MIKYLLIVGLVAQVAQAQLGPCATSLGPLLPDLTVSRRALRADRGVSVEFIETNDCELVEGCVQEAGLRRLLRFTTTTPNIGATALVIGNPAECDLLFHFSECHGHYHLEQYADYRLWTKAGYKAWKRGRDRALPANVSGNASLLSNFVATADLVAGRKQGFCMLDSQPLKGGVGAAFDNCTTNQGISAGWADSYRSNLDCQFIDVTGLAAGRYVLEVEVNPDWVLPESDYANNSAAVRVRLRGTP